MKKKIVFGLSAYALMFFFGGIYIVTTAETTYYELHQFSQLPNAMAMRKDLLNIIKQNQYNITLQRTYLIADPQTSNDKSLSETAGKCLVCHPTPSSTERINSLINQLGMYQALSRYTFAARPGSAEWKNRAGAALQVGNDLVGQLEEIVKATSADHQAQEREFLRKIDQRKNFLFLLVTIGPFFAIGLAFILIRGLTRPINSLLAATRGLKAGNLDYRIRGLQDEFGEVADSFNVMVESLKKQIEELQRTEQLRVCGEMAAGLAHEIRNPLAGMKISIELLLAELDIEERDRDVLVKVIEQIRHIELLMKDLLNYARPATAQPTNVNVNKLLGNTLYFIEKHPSFVSGHPSRRIIKELDDKLPEIFGDPQQLQQVFLNLLLNAVEAAPEGGEITIKSWYDEERKSVAIALSDTGKGIADELKQKIFQPFFTTKGKGTGLGLAVSKRIVEEHGGSIEVADNIPTGATFRIFLPDKADELRTVT